MSPYGLLSPHLQEGADGIHEPTEASVVGRSWVHSMFSRDRSIRANSFGRVRK